MNLGLHEGYKTPNRLLSPFYYNIKYPNSPGLDQIYKNNNVSLNNRSVMQSPFIHHHTNHPQSPFNLVQNEINNPFPSGMQNMVDDLDAGLFRDESDKLQEGFENYPLGSVMFARGIQHNRNLINCNDSNNPTNCALANNFLNNKDLLDNQDNLSEVNNGIINSNQKLEKQMLKISNRRNSIQQSTDISN